MTNQEHALPALGEVDAAIARHLTPAQPQPPAVAGTPTLAAAADLLVRADWSIDRSRLSEEFNAFLTPERVRIAAANLGRLGKPKSIEVSNIGSRGGNGGVDAPDQVRVGERGRLDVPYA